MEKDYLQIKFSQWLSLLPLFLFIIGAAYLGLNKCPDEYGFWPIMTFSLIIALILSKNKKHFIYILIDGMSDKLVILMIMAWLLSGALGIFISKSGLINSIVIIFNSLSINAGFYVILTFIISAIIGTSTGTAVGTVLIVTPVLYSAGVKLGVDTYLILGAILSGGAFGDDFSPLSDTTIAVASTQNIPVGKSVKSRLKYALSAAIPSMLLFYILSYNNIISHTSLLDNQSINYYSFLMLLPPSLVIFLSFKNVHIVNSLLFGLMAAIFIVLISPNIPNSLLFSLDSKNYTAKSIIIDGMQKGVGISVFSILLIGLVSFIISTGIVDKIIDKILKKTTKVYIGELLIVFTTVFINSLLAHNTITIMSIGSFVKNISNKLKINSYRAANLLDISGNTVMHIFPYMITVVLVSSLANKITPSANLNIFKIGIYNFHSIFLFLTAIFVSITGIWRKADKRYSISDNNSIGPITKRST